MQEAKRFLGQIRNSIQQLSGERQKHVDVAQEFVTRFQTIKEDLANMNCSVDFSGQREWMSSNSPWITHVHLTVPRERVAEVMELISRAGIELPDQTKWNSARRVVDGLFLEMGTPDYAVKKAAKTEIIVYEGRDWQDAHTSAVEIESASRV